MNSCHVQIAAGGFLGGREALKVSGLAGGFESRVTVAFGGEQANARSVAALMVLGVIPGDRIDVTAAGVDAIEAARAVAGLIASGPRDARSGSRHTAAGSGVGG